MIHTDSNCCARVYVFFHVKKSPLRPMEVELMAIFFDRNDKPKSLTESSTILFLSMSDSQCNLNVVELETLHNRTTIIKLISEGSNDITKLLTFDQVFIALKNLPRSIQNNGHLIEKELENFAIEIS